MKRYIPKELSYFCLFCSVLLSAFITPQLLSIAPAAALIKYYGGNALTGALAITAMHIGCGFLVFLFLTWCRKFFIIVIIPFLILVSAASYFSQMFNVFLDVNAARVTYTDSLTFARDVVNPVMLAYIIIPAVILGAAMIVHYPTNLNRPKRDPFVQLFLSLAILAVYADKLAVTAYYTPINMIYASLMYFEEQESFRALMANRPKSFEGKFTADKKEDKLTVVFVLGESVRSANFGLAGYKRDTTPLLGKTPGLFTFPNVKQCESYTILATPCVLTGNFSTNPMEQYVRPSLVDAFKVLGFNTAWISPYEPAGDVAIFPDAADYKVYLGQPTDKFYIKTAVDGDLLPITQTFLDKHKDQNNFVVFQTLGSHWFYELRYTDEFRKFTPVAKNGISSSPEEITNSFDNTVLYTDYVLSQIVGMLKDKNAVMVYLSDNTNYLGEDGIYFHGPPHRPEDRVPTMPLVVWGSDIFWQNHKDMQEKLAKADKKQALHTDVAFNTLLDCLGVHSSFIKPNLSLCQESQQ